MEAKLTERCRSLAAAASQAYRNAHGGSPPTTRDVSDADFAPIWRTAWSTLQKEGCQASEADCQTAFCESFYQLVSSCPPLPCLIHDEPSSRERRDLGSHCFCPGAASPGWTSLVGLVEMSGRPGLAHTGSAGSAGSAPASRTMTPRRACLSNPAASSPRPT